MLSSLFWKKDTATTTIPPSKPHNTFIPEPLGLKRLIPSFDDARRDHHQHCIINRHTFPSLTASAHKKERRRCDFDLERACIGSYGKKQPVVLFPPPLPMLARAKDQKSCMPWNYRWRYYKDGRMVIKEFKLDHHDFFQVNRENEQLSPQKVYADKESPTAEQSPPARRKMDKEKMSVVVHFERLLEESSPSPPSQSSESSASSDSTSLPSDIEEEEEGCTTEEAECMDSGKLLLELPQPFRREMVEDETSTVVFAPPISTPPSPKPAFPELCDEAYAIENSILFKGGRLLA